MIRDTTLFACSCEREIQHVAFATMTKRDADLGAGSPARRRFRDFAEGPIEDLGLVGAKCGERADESATETPDPFQVPPEMRAIAERSLEQARQAFDGFIGAAQRAVDMFGEIAGKGVKDIAEKAMTFAEKDVAISFEFARRLVQARDVQEVLKLQTDYVNAQVQLLSEHARTEPVRSKT